MTGKEKKERKKERIFSSNLATETFLLFYQFNSIQNEAVNLSSLNLSNEPFSPL